MAWAHQIVSRKTRKGIVVLQVYNIDLTATAGDVAIDMMCPGDGARVIDWTVQTSTVGVGAFTHNLTLEHGTGAAGVALTPILPVLAEDAAGVIHTGPGLQFSSQIGALGLKTAQGTKIQILNAELGGDITTGAIVDVMVRWQL